MPKHNIRGGSLVIKGVLDRIEDNIASVLVEELGEQFTVPKAKLPRGSEEGTWFTVEKKNDTYIIIAIDKDKTVRESKHSKKLMNQLQSRKKVSRFKRK